MDLTELLTTEQQTHAVEHGEVTGETIGGYKILDKLGQGGMASVYLAERSNAPYERRVAIKLLMPQRLSRTALVHFVSEQQILARLTHPHIAQMIDGDITEAGEPYLVMEYIEGLELHDYLRQQALTLEQRLELFTKIASAVAYAHEHQVIHRDIKPSNILVTKDGEPKLLDFGIAAAVEDDHKSTAYTLLYGSPEQLQNRPMSQKSDIYQLGYILHIILTGQHIFAQGDAETIRSSIAESDSALEHIDIDKAEHCGVYTNHRLGGDLAAIVKKCLTIEPSARYHTVSNLLQDIQHTQTHHPISARDQDTWYCFKKYLRRNRIAVSAASAALIALLSLSATYVISIQDARQQALRELQKNQSIVNFLKSIFENRSPHIHRGQTLSLDELIENARERLVQGGVSDSDISNELLLTIADIYINIRKPDEAISLLKPITNIEPKNKVLKNYLLARAQMLKANTDESLHHLETAFSEFHNLEDDQKSPAALILDIKGTLLYSHIYYYKSEFQRSFEYADKARQRYYGHQVSDGVLLAEISKVFAVSAGRLLGPSNPKIEEYTLEAIAAVKSALGDNSAELTSLYVHLGFNYKSRGDDARARKYFEEALRLGERYKNDRPDDHVRALDAYGVYLTEIGHGKKAIELFSKRLSILQTHMPEQANRIILSKMGIVDALTDIGELSEAKALIEETMILFKENQSLLDNTLRYASAWMSNYIGNFYFKRENYTKSIEHFTKAIQREHEDMQVDNAFFGVKLARAYCKSDQPGKAELTLREAKKVFDKHQEETEVYLYAYYRTLYTCDLAKGIVSTYEKNMDRIIEQHLATYGINNRRTIDAHIEKARLLGNNGKVKSGAVLLQSLIEDRNEFSKLSSTLKARLTWHLVDYFQIHNFSEQAVANKYNELFSTLITTVPTEEQYLVKVPLSNLY